MTLKDNSDHYDIIVVGAGAIGSAFALAAARRLDVKILVLEQAAQIIENRWPNQKVFALGKQATDMLDSIEMLEQLGSDNCYPYESMFVWDEQSAGDLFFDAKDIHVDRLGYMVDAINLTQMMQQALEKSSQITTRYGVSLKHLDLEPRGESNVSVRTAEREFKASLVVGADGVNSWCREQAKIFAHRRSYGQKGIVTRVQTQDWHQETAWQVFLEGGPLALLPLQDNQCSIVWSVPDNMADDLLALSNAQFGRAVCEALKGELGVVEVLSPRQVFPLQSLKADCYFKRGLALIGDSAHAIHPLAGQGANLGFKDIVELVKALSRYGQSKYGDLATLQSYQRLRKSDNDQTDLMMSVLNEIYQLDSNRFAELRGRGMNLINKSSRLKRFLARQAMGLI